MAKTNPNLPPFVSFCTASVPMVFDNSMSYYECLCALTKFIQGLVGTVNINAEQLQQLEDYVKHYFDNLDVQEEINNKLDDMAESGQLEEIIAAYLELKSVLSFDTKAALKAADNLIDGSTAITLGELTYDDGKVNLYKIREKQAGDVVDDSQILALEVSDELIAERIDNIKFTQLATLINTLRDDTLNPPAALCKAECKWSYTINSYYAMVKIPKELFSFTIIPYATTGYDGSYKYVENHPNSIYINGQLTSPTIINGVVTVDAPSAGDQYWYILGIDNNGDPKYTKDVYRTLSGTDLLALGYKEAFGVWCPIVLNGVNFNASSELNTSDSNYDYIVNKKQPRSILGYDNDYWYLIVIDGRLTRSSGTTLAGLQTLMAELGIENAFNMDGGSNTQLWISNPTTNLGIRDNARYVRGYTSNNTVSLLKFSKIGE